MSSSRLSCQPCKQRRVRVSSARHLTSGCRVTQAHLLHACVHSWLQVGREQAYLLVERVDAAAQEQGQHNARQELLQPHYLFVQLKADPPAPQQAWCLTTSGGATSCLIGSMEDRIVVRVVSSALMWMSGCTPACGCGHTVATTTAAEMPSPRQRGSSTAQKCCRSPWQLPVSSSRSPLCACVRARTSKTCS